MEMKYKIYITFLKIEKLLNPIYAIIILRTNPISHINQAEIYRAVVEKLIQLEWNYRPKFLKLLKNNKYLKSTQQNNKLN